MNGLKMKNLRVLVSSLVAILWLSDHQKDAKPFVSIEHRAHVDSKPFIDGIGIDVR